MVNSPHDVASECDLQLVVDSSFGQKFIDAVEFPLQIDFETTTEPDLESYLGEAEVIDDSPSPSTPIQQSEAVDDLEEVIQEVVIEPLRHHDDEAAGVEKEWLNDAETQPEQTAEKKRTKVEILSLSLTVPSAPTLRVGNPIRLADITVKVCARVNVGVRVLGKWRCTKASTPWVTLSGRNATLQLSSQGPVIYGTPVFEDIDMMVTLKVLKWKIKCKLGITRIVNKELSKRGPIELIDLSTLEPSIPYSKSKPRIDSISFSGGSEGLIIKSSFSVTP